MWYKTLHPAFRLTCVLLPCFAWPAFSFSQSPFTKTANDALVVTSMVQKFHVQPKAVDDAFSAVLFQAFINQLDRQKIFFTQEDIQSLNTYKDKLDDEIKGKKTVFLQNIYTLYQKKLLQADTMVDNICRQPFSFTTNEVFTVAEDTSFATNDIALRNKFQKMVKKSLLTSIVDGNSNLSALSPALQKKYIDSAEVAYRKKLNTTFKRNIQRKLQSPGGLQQLVGTEYCKAIAGCFDPHTAYMPVSEKEDFESSLGKKEIGFGFHLDEDDDGNVTINNLKAGSPAFKSGQLNEGDKIEAIQWEGKQPIDVASADMEEVMRILSASNHDKAILKVKKADGSTRQVTLWKEQLETNEEDEEKVKSYILKGTKTVGYISLPAFYEDWENEDANVNGCANDVAKEILKLKKEGIEGLIIDIRYNGGGSMREAVELAGIFIDAGPVAMIKSRDEKPITLKDMNRGTMYDGPLMIMVNGHSASASEMIAGTLQDYNRAVIVGTPTYGKATAQVVLPMDTTIKLDAALRNKKTDAYIKTTISQLYRVNGTTAQANGVKPDIILPDLLDAYPEREGDDPFVIRSSNIEANKYYKPNAALPLALLQSAAKVKVDTTGFFKSIKTYVQLVKQERLPKDVSLQLTKALQQAKQTSAATPDFENVQEASFKVLNNAFELQRMKANSNLAEVNQEWKDALSQDPYVQVVYDLILLMIK